MKETRKHLKKASTDIDKSADRLFGAIIELERAVRYYNLEAKGGDTTNTEPTDGNERHIQNTLVTVRSMQNTLLALAEVVRVVREQVDKKKKE